jgi:hypothetical protein
MTEAAAMDDVRGILRFVLIAAGLLMFLVALSMFDQSIGGDGWFAKLVIASGGSCAGVVGAPFLTAYALKHPETKPLLFFGVLGAGFFWILWLDAAFIMLGQNLASEGPHYVIPAAFFTVLMLAVFPYRTWGWYLLVLGVVGLWGWRAYVPDVGWNYHKQTALDLRRVQRRGTVAELQEVMGDYRARISRDEGNLGRVTDSARIGDLDLESLQPCSLNIAHGLGGVGMMLSDGRVTKISCNFD